MTLVEILASLFPDGHDVTVRDHGLVRGSGTLRGGGRAEVIGVAERTALGVEEALRLSCWVLEAVESGGNGPILVLLDSDSQRMSKHDELLGLNEFLAHLAKCLIYADMQGRHTVGVLYGHTAAGAFIATALATRSLLAIPGAQPEVMDLPSMSRVTKLSIDILEERSESSPIFAPGLANFAQTGAVLATWDETVALAEQLQAVLGLDKHADERDRLGAARHGRPKAADIAERVRDQALQPR
jgi:malonate decarboxylase gamma subunit